MKCIIFLLNLVLCMCINLWKHVDVKTMLYANYILDTGAYCESFTSISYNECFNVIEGANSSVNVIVYSRRYLLCDVCLVPGKLKLNKTPGSILVHFPSRDTTLNNLALRKPSYQSSTLFSDRGKASSDLAVDGIWESIMHRNSSYACTHTTVQASGDYWWMVDLENIYQVSKIFILNREDDCCWDRLRHLTITVGNASNSMAVCNEYEGPGRKGESVCLRCRPPLFGRFVRISKPATEPLQLCEVAVYR